MLVAQGTVLDLVLDDEGDDILFLSHVMTYGTVDDLRVARAHFADEQLREVLRAGPPGVFDARSWAYWHAVLDVRPVPPLPTRRLQDVGDVQFPPR